MELFRKIIAVGTLCLLSIPQLHAQSNIVYDTSPSTGRVVSIRVEDKAPVSLPAVPLPVNPTSQDIAKAVQQLNAMSAKRTPVPRALKYKPAIRSMSPLTTATRFVTGYGKAFGLSNPSREMTPAKEEKDSLGMTHVRFNQNYKGIPVFGAEMIAHVGADGNVKSLNGKVGSGINISTRTKITQAKATTIAKKIFKDKYPALAPTVEKPKLYVYQPALLDNTNSIASYLVWQVRVSNENWIDESYLIDANLGTLVRALDNIRGIKRKIYDCSAEPGTDQCWSNRFNAMFNYTFGCQEGLCPHGPNPRYLPGISTDTDDMYHLMSQVHDYYQTKFGRNGANGVGGNTDGSKYSRELDVGFTYINHLSSMPDDCLEGMYWPASGVGVCKGTVVPDFIGHEYAHGVNPILTYSGESGALDESNSDIMGELFEYWLSGANDWIAGSVEGFSYKKNIADPPSLISPVTHSPYPDRYTSANFYCGTADKGGIHVNSAVLSKGIYLALYGGDFNGCQLTATSREVVEQVLHRAKNQYYSPSESFNDSYYHLIQSCLDLFGEGSDSCQRLKMALEAVEMDQVGRCLAPSDQLTRPASCQCDDSDNKVGTHDISAQAGRFGTVRYLGQTIIDACVTRKILTEYYCDGGELRKALITCPSYCGDGVCV